MYALLMGLASISPRDLHKLVTSHQVAVFDVNSQQSWQEAHVPSSRRLDPATFVAEDLPDDRDATLVFYCSNYMCRKAPNAARRAKRMGYNDVRVMSAGISGWLSAKLPTEAGGAAEAS